MVSAEVDDAIVLPPESPRAKAVRYSLGVGLILFSAVVRFWLEAVIGPSGFVVSLPAILVGCWIGGVGPSLIGITLLALAELVFVAPAAQGTYVPDSRTIITIGVVYLFGFSVAMLAQARRAADFLAQMQKDEALAQRERLRATLSCMGDGVLVTDASGRLTMMNPAAQSMTNWTNGEAAGKCVTDIFAICDESTGEKIESPVFRVLRENQVLHESTRLLQTTRNEKAVPISYNAAPIYDARAHLTGVVLVLRDETERRQADQALRNADRRKDEFLATLAHELRNPLAPICMGLELMKLSPDDQEQLGRVRVMMERQAQHMVRLIDDLLDVSRITRGKLELRRRPVELVDIVRDAVDATRPVIENAQHKLTVELPKSPVLLYADPNRMTQVLSNLLNNAAKFTPPGGSISVLAEDRDAEVAITVADNGLGVPESMQREVFELFTQIHESTKSGQSGLGIGLTLVRRLVEMHEGTISLYSAGRGAGSAFTIRLPAMNRATTVEQGYRPALSQSSSRRRILAVDDNEDALDALCLLIRMLGHDVHMARDGGEAVEMADRVRPEIILMDLGMPNVDGYEAARRIRSCSWGSEVVIVATTGWGQEEERKRAQAAGFDHHLVKPIDMAALGGIIEAPLKIAAAPPAPPAAGANTTSIHPAEAKIPKPHRAVEAPGGKSSFDQASLPR